MDWRKLHVVALEPTAEDGVALFDGAGRLCCTHGEAKGLLDLVAPGLAEPAALERVRVLATAPSAVDAAWVARRFVCIRPDPPGSTGGVEVIFTGPAAVDDHRAVAERRARWFEHSLTANAIAAADGTIQLCNGPFCRLLGFGARAEAEGADVFELVPDSSQREVLRDELARTGEVGPRRFELQARDGSPVFVVARWSTPRDAADAQRCIEVAIYDRTEEQRLESQLMHAQRIEAVGRLAGGVAHDFNNLLTVILNYAKLLERALPSGSAEQRRAQEIQRAGERAGELTRRLLAFGRRQLVRAREVDLNARLLGLRAFLRSLLPANIALDLIAGPALEPVHLDPDLFDQVILNLLVNARDAMPDGGRVTVETENVVLDDSFVATHHWAAPGRYVLVTVTDTGCGMPREVLEHVFEPFFTTKPPGKGSGLGLASAYGIVKQHDGLMHVYSEPGVGTTFKIYLPVARPGKVAGSPETEARRANGRELVLVAEDDPAVLAVTQQLLEAGGYVVLSAPDGAEALRLLQKHIDQVRLIVLDVIMPNMGGVEALVHIRKLASRLPVLLTSGFSGDGIRDQLERDPQLDFIAKPYDPDELLEKVRRAIEAARGGAASQPPGGR